MSRRPRRVIAATLTALVLLSVGALLATATIGQLAGNDPTGLLTPTGERLAASPWQDPGVAAAGVVLLLVGLVLVLAAVLPGRQVILAMDPDDSGRSAGSSAGITRASLQRAVQEAALRVDGVASADASLKGHRVDVRTKSSLRDTSDLRGAVEQAVVARLAEIPLSRQPRVQVRISAPRSDA